MFSCTSYNGGGIIGEQLLADFTANRTRFPRGTSLVGDIMVGVPNRRHVVHHMAGDTVGRAH